jgi:hypothetical protein
MSGMTDQVAPGDSMSKGFAALGDQGDAMKMAGSGNVVPLANPSPSNGLNAAPMPGGPALQTMMPAAQKAAGVTDPQLAQIIALLHSRRQG